MRSTGEGGYDVGDTDLYENRVSLSGEGKSFYIDGVYLYENRVTTRASVQVSRAYVNWDLRLSDEGKS